jgi:hypothetical protein
LPVLRDRLKTCATNKEAAGSARPDTKDFSQESRLSRGSFKTMKRPGGTGVLTCAWAGGAPALTSSLVPKLRLGNHLSAKLLLGKNFK